MMPMKSEKRDRLEMMNAPSPVKKPYTKPTVTVHGSVEQITQKLIPGPPLDGISGQGEFGASG